jgi:hemerythrin-like domain-containing protein
MRRDPALRRLSSDHHTGLVIARRALNAARAGARAQSVAWDELEERFRTELEPHFLREERGLLPALRAVGETLLAERTLAEHRCLRALIAADRPDHLAPFAELLTAHIRFEEGELFDTAQRVLGSEGLAALERDQEDGLRAPGGPAGPNAGGPG